MEQVWVIKNLEKGPLYSLLNAYGLLFYALEDLGMVYWIGMYNSIVKSIYGGGQLSKASWTPSLIYGEFHNFDTMK